MTTITSQYGPRVKADSLRKYLKQVIDFNNKMGLKGAHKRKLVPCIWGDPGIGKTSLVKQLLDDNTIIIDIPLAQLEEMGDLHGMPLKVTDEKGNSKTIYAPPHWVPVQENNKNYIILFDDWNRADIRIIKGIMQLLQNYGTVSWQFPHKTTIILTGNIDDGQQLVQSTDSAIFTRIRHFQLEPDHLIWAEWAKASGDVDDRVISFVLKHNEHFCPKTESGKTNPRTLTEFGELLKHTELSNLDIKIHARSALDDATAILFDKFINEDLKDLIDPVDILEGNWKEGPIAVLARNGKTDMIYTIIERLYLEICNTRFTKIKQENFSKFILQPGIPTDMASSLVLRLVNTHSNPDWVRSQNLSNLIVQVRAPTR